MGSVDPLSALQGLTGGAGGTDGAGGLDPAATTDPAEMAELERAHGEAGRALSLTQSNSNADTNAANGAERQVSDYETTQLEKMRNDIGAAEANRRTKIFGYNLIAKSYMKELIDYAQTQMAELASATNKCFWSGVIAITKVYQMNSGTEANMSDINFPQAQISLNAPDDSQLTYREAEIATDEQNIDNMRAQLAQMDASMGTYYRDQLAAAVAKADTSRGEYEQARNEEASLWEQIQSNRQTIV